MVLCQPIVSFIQLFHKEIYKNKKNSRKLEFTNVMGDTVTMISISSK